MELKAVNIKGKLYVEVKERVKYFCNKFPKWRIETSFPLLTDNECMCEAKIFDEDDRQVRNGHAHEYRKGNINTTSMIENAETSAVGRALGMLGIGIDVAVASADEMRMKFEQDKMIDEAPLPAPSKATKEDRERAFLKFDDICYGYEITPREFLQEKFHFDDEQMKDAKLLYSEIRHYLMKMDNLVADLEAFVGIEKPAYSE